MLSGAVLSAPAPSFGNGAGRRERNAQRRRPRIPPRSGERRGPLFGAFALLKFAGSLAAAELNTPLFAQTLCNQARLFAVSLNAIDEHRTKPSQKPRYRVAYLF